MSASAPRISFVLPAFNEVGSVAMMVERLRAAGQAVGNDYEIVWVDDGSSDGMGEALDEIAAADPRVRVIRFSRNFGHMAALTAGLEAARATGAVISLDSDGQHPPELIPRMVEMWEQGADIVQTVRSPSPDQTEFKRATSNMFYSAMNWLSDLDLPEGAADFRLLDRQAVDALNNLPERDRFLRGLVYWVGFKRVTLPYAAQARAAGTTKYNLAKMVEFALSGITSFSVRPLRLTFALGAVVLMFAAIYAVYAIACYLIGVPLTRGWASLLVTMLVLGGTQLLTLGIIGEYIGRIYTEAKHRPTYIIRKARETDARAGASHKEP